MGPQAAAMLLSSHVPGWLLVSEHRQDDAFNLDDDQTGIGRKRISEVRFEPLSVCFPQDAVDCVSDTVFVAIFSCRGDGQGADSPLALPLDRVKRHDGFDG
jgi:hypothetical protein